MHVYRSHGRTSLKTALKTSVTFCVTLDTYQKPRFPRRISMHGLMTIFKDHLVAAACMELGLDGPSSDWPSLATGQVCVGDLTQNVVTQCTIIAEAILGQPTNKSEDGVYNYARDLCYFASLVAEFTDAWSEGAGKCDTLLGRQKVVWQERSTPGIKLHCTVQSAVRGSYTVKFYTMPYLPNSCDPL